jgi:membrane protein
MGASGHSSRVAAWTRLLPPPLLVVGRYLYATTRRFLADECLLRASGLAYVTLLSLVPLLALMFAVLKGLGAQHRLEPLLLSRFALDQQTADRIVGYIDQTNVGTLGALGAAALILTVVSVLGSVEANLNYIWRVRRGRTYWRKLTDYSAVVLLTPLLLLLAVAITSSLQQQSVLRAALDTHLVGDAALQALRLLPILINAIALFVLYLVMTNRRPYWPGVACGALVAGALWHAVQWGYVAFQIGVARYSAIYGALSQLPITLVWLYLSAAIALAGAELAAVFEFGPDPARWEARLPSQWLIGLQLLVRAADRFNGEGGGVDVRRIARELRLETDSVQAVAQQLQSQGFLAAVADSEVTYVLARHPRSIELGAIDETRDTALPGCDPRVVRLDARLAGQRHRARAAIRLSDVLADTTADAPEA